MQVFLKAYHGTSLHLGKTFEWRAYGSNKTNASTGQGHRPFFACYQGFQVFDFLIDSRSVEESWKRTFPNGTFINYFRCSPTREKRISNNMFHLHLQLCIIALNRASEHWYCDLERTYAPNKIFCKNLPSSISTSVRVCIHPLFFDNFGMGKGGGDAPHGYSAIVHRAKSGDLFLFDCIYIDLDLCCRDKWYVLVVWHYQSDYK